MLLSKSFCGESNKYLKTISKAFLRTFRRQEDPIKGNFPLTFR